ncbi:MAG: hypothetical protein DMF06_03440 [Verrucomicrobia bacterium]|nr:MAG: hypothetical protein DMF06_03440 [Verrucomicrobiota bacterium]
MIDAPTVLHTFLAAQSSLTALTGARIWKEHVTPPVGYKPSQGKALVYRMRGGTLDYARTLLDSSWQFKCYGASEGDAQTLYRALVTALDDKQGAGIASALLEIAGQTLVEPQTDYVYVLCFFSTLMWA